MAVTFLLLAQVFEVLALAPVEESLMDSPLGSRAEIGMAGIRMSPSKPGRGEMKLSKASI
jgi:hypothetical protein